MNLRSLAFWALDAAGKGNRRKNLQDVISLNDRSERSTAKRLHLLEEHLIFVTANIPFYRQFKGTSSLSDFPVLNKDKIRPLRDEMLTEGTATENLHTASTSGSTGTPFRILHSKIKRQRINAESIYFGRLAGYEIGNPLWHLKIWTDRNKHNRLSVFSKNLHPIDVSTFSTEDVPDLFRRIQGRKGKNSIIAYSSSLETIARAFQTDKNHDIPRPKIFSMLGQSEPLSQQAREILFEVFDTYPVGRYGMEETGILAQQDVSADGIYRMNLASHIVEVLKFDNDEQAAAGELGRVVVTDLFNKVQPLIRYDTGDLAVVESYEDGTNFVESLARIDGRSRERIYDVNDKPLTPMIAYNFWWKYPEILQYQIVQNGQGDYLLRIETSESFQRETELINDFTKQVGTGSQIKIEHASSNFRHASGKRQVIVSNYTPPEKN